MSTPFDIPITQPSSGGGGGLPFSSVSTQAQGIITDPGTAGGVIPNFSITITPTSATQKVHLSGVINGEWSALNAHYTGLFIKRNGTSLAPTLDVGNRLAVNGQFLLQHELDNYVYPETCPFSFNDEPETTSELTYEVFVKSGASESSDFYLNRCVANSDSIHYKRLMSSFSAQCFEP